MTSYTQDAARKLRPRRFWYLVAAGVAVAGLLAGVGVFAFSLTALSGSLPRFHGESEARQRLPLDLRAGMTYVIYVDNFEGDPPCSGSGPNGAVTIEGLPQNSFTFLRDGAAWDARYALHVSADGTYDVTCGSGGYIGPYDGEVPPEHFALGEKFSTGWLLGNFFGALAGLVLLPFAGLLVGGVIALVTLSLRSSNKRRLAAARA